MSSSSSASKQPKWIKVCGPGEPAPGGRKVFTASAGGGDEPAEELAIAVFNVDGALHAIDNTCPHRGGPLAEGSLEGPVVTCPWHAWQFDLRTGCHPEAPEISVRRYALERREDGVYVDLAGMAAGADRAGEGGDPPASGNSPGR